MAKLVSKTYGEALFDLAVEENKLDLITEEIRLVKEVLENNEDLIKLLNHPKISREEKITVVENIFKGKLSDEVVGFLVIIVDKGRYNDLTTIFEYFLSKVLEYRNIGVAFVTSAIPLSEEQKEQVERKLLATTKYQQFQMNYTVDESIIGGLIIRIGDRVVDSSIKNQLRNMAKALA